MCTLCSDYHECCCLHLSLNPQIRLTCVPISTALREVSIAHRGPFTNFVMCRRYAAHLLRCELMNSVRPPAKFQRFQLPITMLCIQRRESRIEIFCFPVVALHSIEHRCPGTLHQVLIRFRPRTAAYVADIATQSIHRARFCMAAAESRGLCALSKANPRFVS